MPDTFAGFHAEERASVPVLWRRDDRFKTVRVTFQARRPLDCRAAARSLLPALLLQGTRRSPGRPALLRRMDAMYGASVVPGVEKQSPDHVLRLGLDAVAGRFLPGRPDQLGDGLAFLAEQITDPDLDGEGFRESVFERERRQAADYVRSLVDDRNTWAGIRALEVACEGEPIAIPSTGSLAEIETLRREDPERARQDFLGAGEPLVVAAGAFDRDEFMAAVDRFLAVLPARCAAPVAGEPAWVEPRPTRRLVERVVLQQSKLVGIWRLPPSDDPDLWLARRLFVSLLGGGPHSRLFREVREKQSLAYAVQAGLDRRSGLVTLRAGLDEQAAESVVAETLRQIDELSAGHFDDVELETARSQLLGSIDSVTDSVGGLCRYAADHWLLGVDRDPEALATAYRSLDRERVAASFEGLWLDTVYLLAPSDTAGSIGERVAEEGA